ncbi:2Fe-2S iron-sulfur cluster-binding protein [Henriciella litoralis]|uniref:2Fe-2S iron-sulfur cluster-binding protein n=1 Tax=Henriciella litoralis TaxID=568102 RepID=UPI000A00CFC1|nr:2Fe-2S iron-sulfur cluster-binding protein [Henriciella litoralis]
MAKVKFVQPDGAETVIDIKPGLSVMEGATSAGISGIDADCGGACACATCQVYVDEAWLENTGERTDLEDAMLDFAIEVQGNSRLSCQITMSDALDGLIVKIPPTQR